VNDQEQLQGLKRKYEVKREFGVSLHQRDMEWVFKEAERAQQSDAKHTELNVFLQKRNFIDGLGRHVVDSAILYITRLEESVNVLEKKLERMGVRSEEYQLYKKVLEFYADENNYKADVTNQWEPVIPIDQDRGDKASQVLEFYKNKRQESELV